MRSRGKRGRLQEGEGRKTEGSVGRIKEGKEVGGKEVSARGNGRERGEREREGERGKKGGKDEDEMRVRNECNNER